MLNKIFTLAILSALFLTGCIQPPKPLPTKLSIEKHGSQGPSRYRVRGIQYKVLSTKEAKNYHLKGMATWYGKKFNKKHTSSGERYNMNRLTAAHKTLPFGTRVKVTNLKNGKQIIVTINDRGPFTKNHLIDLSYAAAKKLGVISQGSLPVDISAI